MNKVILMGRLTADPELKQTPNGVPVVRFTIAVNRRFAKEGQQQADFINCTAWQKTAEFLCKYFAKGGTVAVVGTLQSRSWDGTDGKKQHATEVLAEEVYFTGSKSENKPQTERVTPVNTGYPKQPQQPKFDDFDFSAMGFTNMDKEDDLPF